MSKRYFSILLVLGLVAGVFSAVPAQAQEAPVTVPAEVQIDDPIGDANGVNDQDNAYGTPLAGEGDHPSPGGAGGTATDIRKVWFSNTASEISLNIQLNGNPGNLAYDTYFRFSSNVGEGSVAADTTRGCLEWKASVNGVAGAYTGETEGVITDKCNTGTPVAGPLVIAEAEGGGFVITITFPRTASPLFADGQKLTAPFGVSRVLYVGPSPTTATAVTLDNTKRGTDYTITGGGGAKPAPEPEPGGDPKPEPKPKPKPKKCKKDKKKCKKAEPKPPPAPSCPVYAPGEEGAEAETTIVTDAATEEKPVEVPIEAGAGIGIGGVAEQLIAHAYQNVQVDSASASTGLYVRLEMPFPSDYDLYVRNPDGSEAARAAGFNPAPVVFNDTGAGGHTEEEAEQVDGVRTADCQGYTIDAATATGEGGELLLKFWLGEATYPAEEGEGEALTTFFGLLRING